MHHTLDSPGRNRRGWITKLPFILFKCPGQTSQKHLIQGGVKGRTINNREFNGCTVPGRSRRQVRQIPLKVGVREEGFGSRSTGIPGGIEIEATGPPASEYWITTRIASVNIGLDIFVRGSDIDLGRSQLRAHPGQESHRNYCKRVFFHFLYLLTLDWNIIGLPFFD